MKQLVLAIAAIAVMGAAPAPQRPNAPVIVSEIRANCPLTVSFGSYAMGIDGPAFDRIVMTLQYDRAVRGIEQQNWGREGERTLCVNIRKTSEARRVFARVKALIPAKPRGPVTLKLANGREYHSPQTRR